MKHEATFGSSDGDGIIRLAAERRPRRMGFVALEWVRPAGPALVERLAAPRGRRVAMTLAPVYFFFVAAWYAATWLGERKADIAFTT